MLSFPDSLLSRKWWQWRPWHKKSGQTGGGDERSLHSALTLYADLLIIEQRAKDGLSAPEGILLVKENRPDEPMIPLALEGEQIIYLSPDDEPTSVLERLARISACRILLVVALQTQLWSHTGWRLIRVRMRELGHELLVVTPDRQVRAMAKGAGISVAERIRAPMR